MQVLITTKTITHASPAGSRHVALTSVIAKFDNIQAAEIAVKQINGGSDPELLRARELGTVTWAVKLYKGI